MYYAYLLRLSSGNYYSGFSSNLKRRFEAHANGDVPQTRNYRPLELVFYAAFETKIKALGFEKYLKSSSGFAFRNKRLI
jgi:putative endonuclease